MDQTIIKSRPRYSRLRLDSGGRRHLLVCEAPSIPSEALQPPARPEDFGECWTIVGRSSAIPSPELSDRHEFRSQEHLLIALRRRLSRETLGFRLYAIGTEPFLGTVWQVAVGNGLSPGELSLFAVGSAARRVFCNHCRAVTEGVTTNIVTCTGCRASLFVRDHFSRRLNAFAGVQADAEAPGELPEVEELYR